MVAPATCSGASVRARDAVDSGQKRFGVGNPLRGYASRLREAEPLIEAREPRLRRNANRRAGPTTRLSSIARSPTSLSSPRPHISNAVTTRGDRRLDVPAARLERPRIGERLATSRRPGGQVPRAFVEAVGIEARALLLEAKARWRAV